MHKQTSFTFLTDARRAARGLVRRPGYALAALTMLGLAVAANTAVFAVVYGFMLKPLPYPQPKQLVIVRELLTKISVNLPIVSVKGYLDLRQNLNGISDAGLSTQPNAQPVRIAGHTHLLRFESVTPSLFRTLGVQPVLGRWPASNADQPGGPPEALISSRFWRSAYGGNRRVLGQVLKVNGRTYRIVGVMPRNFSFNSNFANAWLPYVITPKRAQDTNINYLMAARVKPGVSLARLNLELHNLQTDMVRKESPPQQARTAREGFKIDARPLRQIELQTSGVGQLPWLLQAAAGLLLLMALANTVNLSLIRQRARQHEFALRRVLGASRSGLARLLLIEHLPIAFAIGGVATLLAWAAIGTLHAFGLPPAISYFQVALAPAVIIFTWILTLCILLIVTFYPALLATSRRLFATLGHGPTATGGRGPRRVQRALGTIQVALACALLVAGGLLGLSLWRVMSQPTGFAARQRTVATIILRHDTKITTAWATLKPQLMQLPGVSSATATDMVPFSGNFNQGGVSKLGPVPSNRHIDVMMPSISENYFSTLGIHMLAGRGFTPEEVASNAPVAVIDNALAKRFFGSARKAIGKTVYVLHPLRVIGVTRDVAWAPTSNSYNHGTLYLTLGAFPLNTMSIVIHTHGPISSSMSTLTSAIHNALPHSVIVSRSTLSRVMQGASVFRAAGAGMVATFAGLALLLAALGVFAITAFIARSRLDEYGIRAALGAGPAALLRLGFGEAAWLLLIGLPIGLAGAYLLGRAIANALYRTPALSPGLYLAGAAVIAAVVMAAAWGPARRAAHTPIRNLIGGGTP